MHQFLGFLRSKWGRFFLVFLLALSFRLFLLITSDNKTIGSDGVTYHKIATNIINGRGYSVETKGDPKPYFFREPGYPIFLAASFGLYSWIMSNPVHHIQDYDKQTESYYGIHGEVGFARLIQSLINAMTIALVFLIICFFLPQRTAFPIAMITAVYYPFAISSIFLIRESLASLILAMINLLFLYARDSNKKRSLLLYALIGLLCGYLSLTLQLYVIFLPFLVLVSLKYFTNFKKSLVFALTAAVFCVIPTIPWLSRTYHYYPDLRTVKSVGTSYTHELKDYLGANYLGYRVDTRTGGAAYKAAMVSEYWKDADIIFSRSYSGYYHIQADSLRDKLKHEYLNTGSKVLKFHLSELLMRIRKSFFINVWSETGKSISSSLEGNNRATMMISLIIGVIAGLLSVLGVIVYFKNTWVFLPVFLFHFLMFYLIGDEGRRMLPFRPYFVMYGLMGAIVIVNWLYRLRLLRKGITLTIKEDMHAKV